MSNMNFDDIEPELPFFSWGGKTYTATKEVHWPRTARAYLKIYKMQLEVEGDEAKATGANTRLINLIDRCFPGTKADKLFTRDDIPKKISDEMLQFVMCAMIGRDYEPIDVKITKKEALVLADALINEKAEATQKTYDEVLEDLRGELNKEKK